MAVGLLDLLIGQLEFLVEPKEFLVGLRQGLIGFLQAAVAADHTAALPEDQQDGHTQGGDPADLRIRQMDL